MKPSSVNMSFVNRQKFLHYQPSSRARNAYAFLCAGIMRANSIVRGVCIVQVRVKARECVSVQEKVRKMILSIVSVAEKQ